MIGHTAMYGRGIQSAEWESINTAMGSTGVSVETYQEHGGACTGASATSTYEGDQDIGKSWAAESEAACRLLCNADSSCNGYDFAQTGATENNGGPQFLETKPATARRCRIHTGASGGDGSGAYKCYTKGGSGAPGPAPAPAPPATYVSQKGGCRTADQDKGDEQNYSNAGSINNAACKAACSASAQCLGYSIRLDSEGGAYCLLWHTQPSFQDPATFKSFSYKYQCAIKA